MKIFVFMGGSSSEKNISIKTGNAIIASLGLCSLGALSPFGPVVLLETVAAATLQGGAAGRYTNHVFIRAL